MNIGAVGASVVDMTQQVGGHRAHHRGPDMDQAMAPTAKLLGLSTSDLKQQVDSGQTLEQIADAQGVSKDDLLGSIKEGLKASKPDGAPELSEAQLTEMAGNIAAGKRPQGPPPGGPGGGRRQSADDRLHGVADALGMDPQELLDQLNSGVDFKSLLGGDGPYEAKTAYSGGGLQVDEYV